MGASSLGLESKARWNVLSVKEQATSPEVTGNVPYAAAVARLTAISAFCHLVSVAKVLGNGRAR